MKRLIPPIILLAMGLGFWWLQLNSTKIDSKDSGSIDREESIKPSVPSEKQQPFNASKPEPNLASKTSDLNDRTEPTKPKVASEKQKPFNTSKPEPNLASKTSDSNDWKDPTKPKVASEKQKPFNASKPQPDLASKTSNSDDRKKPTKSKVPSKKPQPANASEPELAQGLWATDFGRMTIVSSREDTAIKGTYYTKKTGQLYGSIKATMNGNTMTGYWIQKFSQKKCATKMWGTYYWGKLVFIYDSEETFTGKWGYCNEFVDRNWDGEYIGAL